MSLFNHKLTQGHDLKNSCESDALTYVQSRKPSGICIFLNAEKF